MDKEIDIEKLRIFKGKLDCRFLRTKGNDRVLKVLAPFSYVDKDGVEWKIDKPDIWDGASIPKAFWWLIGSPFIGDYRSAAAIHDVFCIKQSRSAKRTHEVFCEMLEDLGLGVMKRTAMCKAVKWFGPKW